MASLHQTSGSLSSRVAGKEGWRGRRPPESRWSEPAPASFSQGSVDPCGQFAVVTYAIDLIFLPGDCASFIFSQFSFSSHFWKKCSLACDSPWQFHSQKARRPLGDSCSRERAQPPAGRLCTAIQLEGPSEKLRSGCPQCAARAVVICSRSPGNRMNLTSKSHSITTRPGRRVLGGLPRWLLPAHPVACEQIRLSR